MKSIGLNELRNLVKKRLSPQRMEHTLGVVEVAKVLAKMHGVDPLKAEIAALAHDMARYSSAEQTKELVGEFKIDPSYCDSIDLAHGKIAAAILKHELGIRDADILNAVSYHTTGRPGMSTLEKIIYVADSIEPGRNYPGVNELRTLAFVDLDKACLKIIENTINYLLSKDCKIHEDTIMARDFNLTNERREDEQ